jgi:hypothetical protein
LLVALLNFVPLAESSEKWHQICIAGVGCSREKANITISREVKAIQKQILKAQVLEFSWSL